MKTTVAIDEGTQAARVGKGIHKWVNDKVPGATAIVLTDATLYYNIPAGHQVFVTQLFLGIETVSDDCHCNPVSCDAVAGGGNATDLCGHFHIFTGANLVGTEDKERSFIPPMRVRYSDGARSISIRVDANDGNTVVTVGWMGWVEAEPA